MVVTFLAVVLMFQSQDQPKASGDGIPNGASQSVQKQPTPAVDKAKLLSDTHRIFVDTFGVDPASQQMQAMIISSLTESKRFTITEDRDKADAILKGVAVEKTSQETHAYSSGTGIATGRGGAAMKDSSVNTESTENAHAAIRLVDRDGDVIWTTTQESYGARFKGASADVAEKVAKQLTRDAEKADVLVAASVKNNP